MSTGQAPPEIAARALALAAGAGDEQQVTVVRERSLVSRFARSTATQATGVDDTEVEILIVRDGHAALASTNRLDDDALRETAGRADAAARASARAGRGVYPGLVAPGPEGSAAARAPNADAIAPPPGALHDDAAARLDPGPAGEALRSTFAIAAGHELEAFGIWTAGIVRTAIASSTGLRRDEAATDAFMKVVCRDRAGRSGFASATAATAAAMDAELIARRAAGKVGGAAVADLEPGEYPVVLTGPPPRTSSWPAERRRTSTSSSPACRAGST